MAKPADRFCGKDCRGGNLEAGPETGLKALFPDDRGKGLDGCLNFP